jgi:hypothetical protein
VGAVKAYKKAVEMVEDLLRDVRKAETDEDGGELA